MNEDKSGGTPESQASRSDDSKASHRFFEATKAVGRRQIVRPRERCSDRMTLRHPIGVWEEKTKAVGRRKVVRPRAKY